MARVNHGPIVQDATGKAGDVVFAHYFGTPYVRQRQRAYVSNTQVQQDERDLFRPYAKAYGFTNGPWRNSLKPIAYTHNKYLHVFLLSAFLRERKGAVQPKVFPTANGLPPFRQFALTQDANNISISVDPEFIDANGKWIALLLCDSVANTFGLFMGHGTSNPDPFPKFHFGPPGQTLSVIAIAFTGPTDGTTFFPETWNAGICDSILIT